ncbi:TIGR00730 family Rossman fold protein [Listeria costaricensis]|uniref:LOG family protein n=1 Tax=Listeria costaricensis TaxID=2026604 RepID=UPI000C08313F|nr:TIGR00730 family Rossman fold protein [Listeria costaricensis]
MNICVYCGSNPGKTSQYTENVTELAQVLSGAGHDLIYGGGSLGLMRVMADEMLKSGRHVTGVMPKGLFRSEMVHQGLSELIEVHSMPERKAEMIRLSDAFIALPGGFGTLEEISEVLSYAQLGLHQKPIAFFNINGFYDPLITWVKQAIQEGFIHAGQDRLFINTASPLKLVEQLANYQQPEKVNKWQELEA